MEIQRGGRCFWFLFVMTSSIWKKPVPASIISRWLSPNPSVSEKENCFAAGEQQQEIYCQFFFSFSRLEVLLVRHLASAPATYNSALASPHWAMESTLVLREQFKCRAAEKTAPAHDRQMYMLISKIFFRTRYDWLQDCFNKQAQAQWSLTGRDAWLISLLLHTNMNIKL